MRHNRAMEIRPVTLADGPQVTAIYAHHVRHGTASYEVDPPSEAEMAARIGKALDNNWPWLVAEIDGEVAGYAYVNQFRDRAAYRFGCENSIYVRSDSRGKGVGKVLLGALLEAAEQAGFRQMVAVIGGGEPASVALHAALGFRHAGRLEAIGRKHGRWLDTVYMQRALGPGSAMPPGREPD